MHSTALARRFAVTCLLIVAAASVAWIGVAVASDDPTSTTSLAASTDEYDVSTTDYDASTADYDVSTVDRTPTPTQTVEIDGSTFTISAVATADPDDSFTAIVDVPDGTSYALDVYNDDEQAVVDTVHGKGSEHVTVPTDGVEPGTYAISLQVDASVVAVMPLVVEGYAVTVTADDEIHPDDGLTATVEVAPTAADGEPAGVEVATWSGDEVVREPAASVGDGTYEATFDGLEEGEYEVYAAAQGTDTVMGEPEALGIGDGPTVTVTSDADGPGDGPGGGAPGDDPGGDDPGGDDPGGDPGDENVTDDPNDGDPDENVTDDGGETPGTDRGDENGTDDLLRPSESDGAADGTDEDGDPMPFVGPVSVVSVLAVVACVLAVRERRREG